MSKRICGYLLLILGCGAAVFSGCSASKPANGLYPVKFLTDWYPQPEIGRLLRRAGQGLLQRRGP